MLLGSGIDGPLGTPTQSPGLLGIPKLSISSLYSISIQMFDYRTSEEIRASFILYRPTLVWLMVTLMTKNTTYLRQLTDHPVTLLMHSDVQGA